MTASNPLNLEIWDITKKRLKKLISDHNEIVTTLSFYSTIKPKYINLNKEIRKMFISQKDDKNSNFNSFKFSEEMFFIKITRF